MLNLATGVLIISGVAALLALLLEVADSYLGFYEECRIDINQGEKTLQAQGGTLLSSLVDQGIFIPSACGGRGSCGYCKLKVLDGGGPLLPTETPYLEPEELQDNVRLSCQIKMRNNLAIEIPPELFLVKEYTTRVAATETLTEEIKSITLKLSDPEGLPFKPGQYIQLEVPESDVTDEAVYRAYSIASSAATPGEITLIVGRVEEGIASTYIHDYLKQGDEVSINGPHGDFYLRDTRRDILLVGTGTGLAPLMSILHQLDLEQVERKATLVFGERTQRDLFYQEEIRDLQSRVPTLEYIPTLSRPKEDGSWEGSQGRVTAVLEKIVQDGADTEAYLCGSPAMVESCIDLLVKKGLPPEQIFYDKFE